VSVSKEMIIKDMQVRASGCGPAAHVTSASAPGPEESHATEGEINRTQVLGSASARDSQVRRHEQNQAVRHRTGTRPEQNNNTEDSRSRNGTGELQSGA
jgi:hypothetical protein